MVPLDFQFQSVQKGRPEFGGEGLGFWKDFGQMFGQKGGWGQKLSFLRTSFLYGAYFKASSKPLAMLKRVCVFFVKNKFFKVAKILLHL